jgi:hypothetical protein
VISVANAVPRRNRNRTPSPDRSPMRL